MKLGEESSTSNDRLTSPINFTESANQLLSRHRDKERAITSVSNAEWFDKVDGEMLQDFEWSDAKISEKLKGMEMKDIFDIDLVNIP